MKRDAMTHLSDSTREAIEVAQLAASTARMNAEAQQIQAQTRGLRDILARRAALAKQLRAAVQAAQSERRSIEKELHRVLRMPLPMTPRPAPRRASGRLGSSPVGVEQSVGVKQ